MTYDEAVAYLSRFETAGSSWLTRIERLCAPLGIRSAPSAPCWSAGRTARARSAPCCRDSGRGRAAGRPSRSRTCTICGAVPGERPHDRAGGVRAIVTDLAAWLEADPTSNCLLVRGDDPDRFLLFRPSLRRMGRGRGRPRRPFDATNILEPALSVTQRHARSHRPPGDTSRRSASRRPASSSRRLRDHRRTGAGCP